jgi:hypothetical protein
MNIRRARISCSYVSGSILIFVLPKIESWLQPPLLMASTSIENSDNLPLTQKSSGPIKRTMTTIMAMVIISIMKSLISADMLHDINTASHGSDKHRKPRQYSTRPEKPWANKENDPYDDDHDDKLDEMIFSMTVTIPMSITISITTTTILMTMTM